MGADVGANINKNFFIAFPCIFAFQEVDNQLYVACFKITTIEKALGDDLISVVNYKAAKIGIRDLIGQSR